MREQFEVFFQNYQQPALLVTLAGEILAINPSARKYFAGVEDEELVVELRDLLKNINQDLLNKKNVSVKKAFLSYYGELKFTLMNFDSQESQQLALLIFEPKKTPSKTWLIDQITLDKGIQALVHELKAPLVSIFGFTSALQEDYAKSLDQQALEYLESVIRGAKRLDEKLAGLAELTQITNRAKRREVVQFKEILQEAWLELKPMLEKRKAEITTLTEFPMVFCNRSLMVKVLVSLISNAVKFTPSNQNPSIKIGCRTKLNFYEFWVQDQGIGVSPEIQKKVFEPFYRVKELHKVEGVGLGLTLVQRIIEAHDGKVWLDSQLGKGSCFYFSLPV
jgi:signal transduction histidine kinase